MEAAAVVDLGMSRAEFWELTPADFDRFFRVHLKREHRLDARCAVIAKTIANYAGRHLPDGKMLTTADILGTPGAPAETSMDRIRQTLDPVQAAGRFIENLKLSDPQAEVTMSKAVIDSLARGQGTWTKLGTREGLTQPLNVIKVMQGWRPENGKK